MEGLWMGGRIKVRHVPTPRGHVRGTGMMGPCHSADFTGVETRMPDSYNPKVRCISVVKPVVYLKSACVCILSALDNLGPSRLLDLNDMHFNAAREYSPSIALHGR